MTKVYIAAICLTIAGLGYAYSASQTSPAQVNGCVYNSGTVTLTNRQSYVFLCDANGRLLTN